MNFLKNRHSLTNGNVVFVSLELHSYRALYNFKKFRRAPCLDRAIVQDHVSECVCPGYDHSSR